MKVQRYERCQQPFMRSLPFTEEAPRFSRGALIGACLIVGVLLYVVVRCA